MAVALPTSPARAAPLVDAHSLLLQQQAHSSHSSHPRKCLNHTMDSPATGFCSSGSLPGNEGNFPIPMPLLLAINLPQKNGPWKQLLWSLGASWEVAWHSWQCGTEHQGHANSMAALQEALLPTKAWPTLGPASLGMEGAKGMRHSPALSQRTSERNGKMISNLGLGYV